MVGIFNGEGKKIWATFFELPLNLLRFRVSPRNTFAFPRNGLHSVLHKNPVKLFFELGITDADIVLLLNDKHGSVISESTLK